MGESTARQSAYGLIWPSVSVANLWAFKWCFVLLQLPAEYFPNVLFKGQEISVANYLALVSSKKWMKYLHNSALHFIGQNSFFEWYENKTIFFSDFLTFSAKSCQVLKNMFFWGKVNFTVNNHVTPKLFDILIKIARHDAFMHIKHISFVLKFCAQQ